MEATRIIPLHIKKGSTAFGKAWPKPDVRSVRCGGCKGQFPAAGRISEAAACALTPDMQERMETDCSYLLF